MAEAFFYVREFLALATMQWYPHRMVPDLCLFEFPDSYSESTGPNKIVQWFWKNMLSVREKIIKN